MYFKTYSFKLYNAFPIYFSEFSVSILSSLTSHWHDKYLISIENKVYWQLEGHVVRLATFK